MFDSPYRDFRIDFPVGHTYTPEGGRSELKLIFAAHVPISRIAAGWKRVWNSTEMMHGLAVPSYYFTWCATLTG
jgi:hypothetical protein